MFRKTYRMRFNHDHFEAVKAVTDTLGINIGYCFTADSGTTEVEFKTRKKNIDLLVSKLNKYVGTTVIV